MHDHDYDLIAALAEERLTGEERRRAEQTIGRCAVCSDELEAQRLALQALHSMSHPRMTDIERQTLHRSLRRPTASRSPRWVRLAPAFAAAAALVAVFGVVAILQPGGTGRNVESVQRGETFETVSSVLQGTGKEQDDTSTGQEYAPASTVTTAAAATAMAPDGAEESSVAPVDLASTDIGPFADSLRQSAPEEERRDATRCASDSNTYTDETLIASADATVDGKPSVVLVYGSEAIVLDAETCTLTLRVPAG